MAHSIIQSGLMFFAGFSFAGVLVIIAQEMSEEVGGKTAAIFWVVVFAVLFSTGILATFSY